MSTGNLYRRSLRHMSVEALRDFIKAELEDLNKSVIEVSTALAAVQTENKSPSLDEISQYIEMVEPDSIATIAIQEILNTIKAQSKQPETELADEIAEANTTRQELYDTVMKFKDANVD